MMVCQGLQSVLDTPTYLSHHNGIGVNAIWCASFLQCILPILMIVIQKRVPAIKSALMVMVLDLISVYAFRDLFLTQLKEYVLVRNGCISSIPVNL